MLRARNLNTCMVKTILILLVLFHFYCFGLETLIPVLYIMFYFVSYREKEGRNWPITGDEYNV